VSELKQSPAGENTPIVIVTSVYKGRKYRNQAFHQHRCDEYLEKPFSPEKLLSVVQRFLDPEGLASAPVAATPRQSAAGAAGKGTPDATELEIMERLDEILPDLSSLKSEPNDEDEKEAVVVSFDPGRSRQRPVERPAAPVAAVAPRRSSRAALDTARVPDAVRSAEPSERPARVPSASVDAAAKSGKGWIWIAVAVAVVITIVLVMLSLPR
jgi:hypothetical protein